MNELKAWNTCLALWLVGLPIYDKIPNCHNSLCLPLWFIPRCPPPVQLAGPQTDHVLSFPCCLAQDAPPWMAFPCPVPPWALSFGIISSESLPSSLSQAVLRHFFLCSPNKFYHETYLIYLLSYWFVWLVVCLCHLIEFLEVRDLANSHICWSHVSVNLMLGTMSGKETSTRSLLNEHIQWTFCKQSELAQFISWTRRCLKELNLLLPSLKLPSFSWHAQITSTSMLENKARDT